MLIEPGSLLAIAGMAIVTQATRLGGYWLAGRFTLSARMEQVLNTIPGAVIVAIVAPAILAEGIRGLIAAAVSVIAMRFSGSLLLTLIIGVIAIWLLRQI